MAKEITEVVFLTSGSSYGCKSCQGAAHQLHWECSLQANQKLSLLEQSLHESSLSKEKDKKQHKKQLSFLQKV